MEMPRLSLYRLPERRVSAAASPAPPPPAESAAGGGSGGVGRPAYQPQAPRILAVPVQGTGPGSPGNPFAERLMAITSLAGIRAYAETRSVWALWHPDRA